MDTNPFPAPHRRRSRNRGLRPEAVITALIVVFVLVAGVATPFVTSFAGAKEPNGHSAPVHVHGTEDGPGRRQPDGTLRGDCIDPGSGVQGVAP